MRDVTQYVHTRRAPLHERLNLALTVLWDHADDTGYGSQVPIRQTLIDATGMSDSNARYYMDSLRKLGAYTATTGYKSSYQLNPTLRQVSAEMVAAMRSQRPRRKRKKSLSSSNVALSAAEIRAILLLVNQMSASIQTIETQLANLKEQLAAIVASDHRLLRALTDLKQADATNQQPEGSPSAA